MQHCAIPCMYTICWKCTWYALRHTEMTMGVWLGKIARGIAGGKLCPVSVKRIDTYILRTYCIRTALVLGMYLYIPALPVRTTFVLVCTMVFTGLYSVCTCTYLLLPLSSASQDFEVHCVLQTCWCPMSSNHQPIQTWTWVILAWRMKIVFNQDWMQRPWKRQSAGLWEAWRYRNAVASRTCTDF